MNQTTATKTGQEQLIIPQSLYEQEKALYELMAINEAIDKYEASKNISSIPINPSGIATALQSLEGELNKGVDYQQLPYRHTHNCIFPNGSEENRVWHSCL